MPWGSHLAPEGNPRHSGIIQCGKCGVLLPSASTGTHWKMLGTEYIHEMIHTLEIYEVYILESMVSIVRVDCRTHKLTDLAWVGIHFLRKAISRTNRPTTSLVSAQIAKSCALEPRVFILGYYISFLSYLEAFLRVVTTHDFSVLKACSLTIKSDPLPRYWITSSALGCSTLGSSVPFLFSRIRMCDKVFSPCEITIWILLHPSFSCLVSNGEVSFLFHFQ